MAMCTKTPFSYLGQFIAPGCRTWEATRGWNDPAPEYNVEFRNGTRFAGFDRAPVLEQATTYAQSVKNLTGEWP